MEPPVDLVRLSARQDRTAAAAAGTLHEPATAGPRFETVEISPRAFLAVRPALALGDLSRVRVETVLTPAGAIVLDNLTLRRAVP